MSADLVRTLETWSAEMDRSASAIEGESDGSPIMLQVIDGNRAIAKALQDAAIEVRRLRDQTDLDLSTMTRHAVELAHLRAMLARHRGNRAAVAAAMGIAERSVYRMLQEFAPLLTPSEKAEGDVGGGGR